MNLKKITAIAASVVLAAGALAGCGTPETSGTGGSATSAPANAAKVITGADDLKEARVGVQEGTTGDLYVSDELGVENVSRFKRALDATMDLKNGKLDAVVVDDLVAQKLIANNSGMKILPEELTKEEYAIAVKKDNAELAGKINDALAKMEVDGTIQKIYDAYVQEDEAAIKELEEKPAPAGDGKLIMGTNAEFPPFEFKDDAGNIAGYDVEIAKEIARQVGMELQIEDMAFDSLVAALSTGKVDMVIAGMTVTDERKANVDFSDNYYSASQVIIVKE